MQRREEGSRSSVGRDRLIATARQLFTRHGASNVGINEVTDAAGVARMTLYNNFPSKDALIVAVYEEMTREELQAIGDIDTSGRSEEERILAVFDHFDRSEHIDGYRGCAFIHASSQPSDASGPIYSIVHSYKRALRDHIVRLLDPGRTELADQLLLLMDGAVTEAYLQGVSDPISMAKRAATLLIRHSPR